MPGGIAPGCQGTRVEDHCWAQEGQTGVGSHHPAPSQGTVAPAQWKGSKFTYPDPNHINKIAPQGSQMSTPKFGSFATHHTSSTTGGGL